MPFDSSDLLRSFERLHTLVAHVAPPLVLWVACTSFVSRSDEDGATRRRSILLLIATLAGLITAASGWSGLQHAGHELDPIQRVHRVVGIALAALLPVAFYLTRFGGSPARIAARVATFAAAGLAALSLQLGATLLFEEGPWIDSLTQSAPAKDLAPVPPAKNPKQPEIQEPAPARKAETPPTPVPDPVPNVVTPAPVVDLDARLEALRASGLRAQRVFLDAPTIDVNASFLGADFGDEDLALLDGLEGVIETLVLSTTAITDAAGPRLARLSGLDSLRLDRTAFGDAGLAALAQSPVRVLNLYDSAVTDAGLSALGDLPRLERVFLWKTAVTDEKAAALAAALPELEIVR